MKFIVYLDAELKLFAYSEQCVLGGRGQAWPGSSAPSRERYVYSHDAKEESFERREFDPAVDLAAWLTAGYVKVTEFVTKASSFSGIHHRLQGLTQLFRHHYDTQTFHQLQVGYAEPVIALVKWATARQRQQVIAALPDVQLLRDGSKSTPTRFDYIR